jgi:hypothetical protein
MREKGGESCHSREVRVKGNSLVESPKCSIGVAMGNQYLLQTPIKNRKEIVESPLPFRENLRNSRREEETKKKKGGRTLY